MAVEEEDVDRKDVERDAQARKEQETVAEPADGRPITASSTNDFAAKSDDKDLHISRSNSRTSTASDFSISPAPPSSIPAEKKSFKLTRTISTKSQSPSVIPVPLSDRRGLLARFCLTPEIPNPYHYTNKTKWFITFCVAMSAAAAPIGSAIILPGLKDIALALDTTPVITNLSVALYMLAMSIFPLWWSSFSETLGRRTIFISSFALFLVWNVLSAVSSNIAMFIVMRILAGGASASVQAVGAGTIADIWESRERGRAMGIFYLGPLCGPLLAPIIGGVLTEKLGWRSTLWCMVIYGGIVFVLLVFGLPETLRARRNVKKEAEEEALEKEGVIDDAEKMAATQTQLQRVSTRQSVQVKTKKYLKMLRRFFIDPLKIILLLRFPAVALTVYYASITFGSLYFLNISIETTFGASPYYFSTIIVGLAYIPNSLGYLLASVIGGRWIDYIMKREAKKRQPDNNGNLIFRPEDRMRENAWIAGAVFPCALIWYGWSVQFGVHWIVPVSSTLYLPCAYAWPSHSFLD